MTPAGTSNELDGQNEWEENTHTLLLYLNTFILIYLFTITLLTRSTIEGGRGCNDFVPVLGGNGTKIAPTGDIFDQTPGQM